MTNRHGDFLWYDLMTPDADGACAFHGARLTRAACIERSEVARGNTQNRQGDRPSKLP